ncbi:MAG: hypothetical protein SGARI_004997 [Bacillariaceae sp.]
MVGISTTAPKWAYDALSSPRSSPSNRPNKRPLWLYCVYLLFALVCWNAVRTYQRQRDFVRSALEEQQQDDIVMEDGTISYSAGAEEHVVSGNYGSSMYGGGIHTARSKPKTTPTRGARMAKLEKSINPKPSDGSSDFNARKPKKVASSDWNGFSFYVMTDTPYTEVQQKRLRQQMADIRDHLKANPQQNITFGVHLGNTQKVSNTLCFEKSYQDTSYLLGKGPRPTLVVPGNSDWFDCPYRDESFELFMKYYGPDFITDKWHTEHYEPLGIERSPEHPELFVFYVEGILFIGVHLLHVPVEEESHTSWDNRMKMNMEWVAQNVESYFEKYEMRGAVVLGHAARTARTRPFFDTMSRYFTNITSRQDLPVMYLHGHGGFWQVDQKFSEEIGWDNFVDVQIHQGGLADPMIIDVAPQKGGKVQALIEEHGNQTSVSNGLFRFDKQQGVYANPLDILEHAQ